MPEWEYVSDGWSYLDAHPEVRGWDVSSVVQASEQRMKVYERWAATTGPLGLAPDSLNPDGLDLPAHNAVMSFGYAFARASARAAASISMLDWGGGLGHYYVLACALFPHVTVEYHSRDMPLLAQRGRELKPYLQFHSDDCCLERGYDLVMASVSLHYERDWQTLLRKLIEATCRYLYLAQVPLVLEAPSFVFVQRPHQYGYDTEYLAWCINRDELLACVMQAGLHLEREFTYGYQPAIHAAPERCTYRGFLFSKEP